MSTFWALALIFSGVGLCYIIVFWLVVDKRPRADESDFTKTDLVVLMQVLNKVEAKSWFGDDVMKHLPRLQDKVDKKLLKFINEEQKSQL